MDPTYVFACVHLIFAYKLLFWSERSISLGTWVITVSLSLCATIVFLSAVQVVQEGGEVANCKDVFLKIARATNHALRDLWRLLNQDV